MIADICQETYPGALMDERTFLMKRLLPLTLLSAAIATPSQAAYTFDLRAQVIYFFGQTVNDIKIETDGIKQYAGSISTGGGNDMALAQYDTRFDRAKAKIQVTGGFSAANYESNLTDTLRVSNSQTGPVTLKFDLPTSGTITSNGSTFNVFAMSQLYINGTLRCNFGRGRANGGDITDDPEPYIATFAPGSLISIRHRVRLFIDAPGQGKTASVDFMNTSYVTVESLTAGGGFTADSGSAYAPVPEPASIFALVGALVLVKRRKVAIKGT